jgi:hypothetical protein
VSEANPDREQWSKDPAAPTIDGSVAPASSSGLSETDAESTAIRRPRSTKPRTGAPRVPRPAGSAPRKPATASVPGAGESSDTAPNPFSEDSRVTPGQNFSSGLDHLPKATPADAGSPFEPPRSDWVESAELPVWTPPTTEADASAQPSVLERARAFGVAAAAAAKEKVAQVSTAATTTAPVPVSADPAVQAVKRPRRTRRARLRISRVDPWSVMKTSLLFGIAGGIIFVVATYVLMSVVEATGLFTAINSMVKDVLASPTDTTTFDITTYINTKRATGLAALIGAIDVVIFTALATVFSFLYNLSATMLGGLEITLAED